MAVLDFAPEFGATFYLSGPVVDMFAQEASFNNPGDPRYVGMLSSLSGLDSPEVRENGEDLVEFDGGVSGPNYYGRRPIVLEGLIYGHSSKEQRSEKIALLRRASNLMRQEGQLIWLPSVENAELVYINVKRQMPLRIEGGWNKTFQLPLIASDPHIYSYNSYNAFTPTPSELLDMENKGDATAWPVYTILGPMTGPISIVNNAEPAPIMLDTDLDFGEALIVDTLKKTVHTTTRAFGSRHNFYKNPTFEGASHYMTMPNGNMTLSIIALPGGKPAAPSTGTKVLQLLRSSSTENTLTMNYEDAIPAASGTTVAAGDQVTAGFSYLAEATPSNGTPAITFTWRNSGGTILGSVQTVLGVDPTDKASTSVWKRFIATSSAAPANTAKVDVGFQFTPFHTVSNTRYYVDAITIEKGGGGQGDYFSATDPLGGHIGYWTGTADASSSWSVTTESDPYGTLAPHYEYVNFAGSAWSGLAPGDNQISVSFAPVGGQVGASFRADWRHTWI